MAKRNRWKRACAVLLLFAAAAIASQAQTFDTLVSFDGSDGASPYFMSLIQGTDGYFHGTTAYGGNNSSDCNGGTGCGTVFTVTPEGGLFAIYSFCATSGCGDGAGPYGALVQGTDGNFYGTTTAGGVNCAIDGGCGTVFKITPVGCCEATLTTLYSFCAQTGCTDGEIPYAGLVLGRDGNFYGTTEAGGENYGTIFKIAPAGGALTTLHTFDSTDGAAPYGGLVQATNGDFYGTTFQGGTSTNCSGGCGTVFKITAGGTFKTLHSFDLADGFNPHGVLVQASNGYLYGTTSQGGSSTNCLSLGCGTVFEITEAGTFSSLYSFCIVSGCPDGTHPDAGMVVGTDGDLYGTTFTGGGVGTVFQITSGGTLKTLSGFSLGGNLNGLVQGTDGDFYGATYAGGVSDDGAIFSLSMALGPFVKAQPAVGKVGAAVTILGTSLTGATGVSFDGTAATFTVVSASEITTTVPAAAKTGKLKVTGTSAGALASNVSFHVTPQIKSFTPASGAAGTAVAITGVSLTQTSKVTFGGVAATSFEKNSNTKVTATVPTGAKTGKIEVTTSGGTATTAKTFTVTIP